ncbi:hypothetical protein [uncultured Lactobacillus sp.]|uniref:hypothetical protein n=1 Tax=uncultured Lactobacillus sp. TaxID=153152 RepID=UPI0025971698|nr:hypothetical protein [uncultured Lactobacillus sp.]
MEAKTGKELLGAIHDNENMERINRLKGTDSLAVWCGDNLYIISNDSNVLDSDFHTPSEFLKWRLKLLGVTDLTHEMDTTEYNFFDEILDAIDNDWTTEYIKEILTDCYHMEDLSLC